MTTYDEVEPGIVKLDNGRFMRCYWHEASQQWRSRDLPGRAGMGHSYCYSVGPTPQALARLGIRTYPTLSRARGPQRKCVVCDRPLDGYRGDGMCDPCHDAAYPEA